MIWFWIALVGPFLYALTNHIDKILLEKYFKHSGIGTLLLFSSLLSVLSLPIWFLIDPTIFNVSWLSILILSLVGLLDVLILVCYFFALKDDEASIVVVFYQLMPVFAYGLGYLILGEILTNTQLLAMSLIIFGTAIVSFEVDTENRFRLRRKTIAPMLLASFFWALEGVIFKAVALEENVWRSLFWEHAMLTLIGIIIFVFIRSYRDHFLEAVRNNSKAILSLNFLNEGLYMLGNFMFAFAFMLAPVALVLLTQSFQPFFVFAIGLFMTMFFPKIIVEKIHIRHVVPKIAAIILTGIGVYILSISSSA